jgi:hypothetical protein
LTPPGVNYEGTIELYGKWQLEPLRLPRAVNGIVPKVNCYSTELVVIEKCKSCGKNIEVIFFAL